jgi:hypothetical protein
MCNFHSQLTLGCGTCAVWCKSVHKPVDVSLTLTSKDITVCALSKNLAGPRNEHRHDSGFALARTAGYSEGWNWDGGKRAMAASAEGQKFDQAGPVKNKSRRNFRYCAGQRTYTCSGLWNCARIGRQGAESPTNSVVPQFGEIAGRSRATLVDLMNTTGLYSLANRKAPRPDTRASALRGGGRLPHGFQRAS